MLRAPVGPCSETTLWWKPDVMQLGVCARAARWAERESALRTAGGGPLQANALRGGGGTTRQRVAPRKGTVRRTPGEGYTGAGQRTQGGEERAGESRGAARGRGEQGSRGAGRWYWNITGFPFPLRPFLERKTLRTEIQKDTMWCFEQEQGLGFSSVTTNIRMTVIRLESGGLWVHAPIAPTQECLALLKELGGPLDHIVLPTFAYEHKVFVGPFSRRFPGAQVWTAPAQWSWPLNLPLPFLGIFSSSTLCADPDQASAVPWASEIPYKILATPEVGIGPYVEVAFFHRRSKTLLLTDAVILVPRSPPPVVSPQALLAEAQNGLAVQVLSRGREVPQVDVQDTPQFRTLGWQRMVLLILYFGPSNLLEPAPSFSRIVDRLIVSPVVKTLVFDKVPGQVLRWVESITSDWDFSSIIPAHFAAPIRAGPSDLRKCFEFLNNSTAAEAPSEAGSKPGLGWTLPFAFPFPPFASAGASFPDQDLQTLKSLDNTLVSLGAVKKTGT